MICYHIVIRNIYIIIAFCFILGQSEWDGLRAKWGRDKFSHLEFASQPRTEKNAQDGGFYLLSNCTQGGKFAGKRYMKGSDPAIILIYDIHGYIAGMQAGIPKDLPNGYPTSNLIPTPFVEDGDMYFLTAYFVDPSIICTTGRTGGDFWEFGTGSDFYIQNGTDPIQNSVLIPKYEKYIGSTLWTRGDCFHSMGMHYWYNLRRGMSCDEFYPVFLMYNGGKLNAFGWAIKADLPSPIFEHPPIPALKRFFDIVPHCLNNIETVSALHIYLTYTGPITNRC